MTKTEAKIRIAKLRKEIDHHRYLYHVLDKEEISQGALDSLKHELYLLEKDYPDLVTPDSPTQRVGSKPLKQFKKVAHRRPVLSIEDAFSIDEVKDWQARNEKLLKEKIKGYYGELKMDGLAIVLIYDRGLLAYGATRGDGRVGEDVTSNLRTIESIPLRLANLDNGLPSRIDIRGEVVIYKKELDRINKRQEKNNLPLFANPRNLAAGSIRQLDPKIAAARQMNFFAFEIMTDVGQITHDQVHALLTKWGFKTNPHCRVLNDINKVANYIEEWQKKRLSLPYQTDGAVVVVNDIKQQLRLGSVGKTERWMVAYKFPAEQATTQVKDIIVQVGRTGVLTPVALLQPVKLAGTTISRATLHNQDEINRLSLKIGDTVIVQKAGDIIPDIVKVLTNLRTGQEKIFKMPHVCPVCKSPVVKKEGEVAWYCANKNCFAVQSEKLRHFVSRQCFDIDGLGPKILDQLLSVGLIKDAADIFTLTHGDLEPLQRFAEKSADNLVVAISKAKNISLVRFINALGIRHVGQETAVALADQFKVINRLFKVSAEELVKIVDIGPVVAKSIYDFFQDRAHIEFINRLQKFGVKVGSTKPRPMVGKLIGKILVVTGVLNNFSREQAKQAIRDAGGKVSESVSSKTNYVVTGQNSGSKLTKARELGIKVISEEEFDKLIK